jgi:hypothetical protein
MKHDLFLVIEIVLVAGLFFSCLFMILLCIIKQTKRAKEQRRHFCPRADVPSKLGGAGKKLRTGGSVHLN